MSLFHIVELGVWREAAESGWYRPDSVDPEGVVHCSFAGQVAVHPLPRGGTGTVRFGHATLPLAYPPTERELGR
jgi:hypothetical protein